MGRRYRRTFPCGEDGLNAVAGIQDLFYSVTPELLQLLLRVHL
jgi:hypothetical protein